MLTLDDVRRMREEFEVVTGWTPTVLRLTRRQYMDLRVDPAMREHMTSNLQPFEQILGMQIEIVDVSPMIGE